MTTIPARYAQFIEDGAPLRYHGEYRGYDLLENTVEGYFWGAKITGVALTAGLSSLEAVRSEIDGPNFEGGE